MKLKSVFYLFVIFFCFIHSSLANVFRVNNKLTTDASQKIFKTIKEAHDASIVLAGDTLMIEGSSTVYADITLTKRLVLIGPGYFLSQNPQTAANVAQAVVSNITIKPEASGSILQSLTFNTSFSSDAPYIEGSNIVIARCYLPNSIRLTGDISNIQIIQNFFKTSGIIYSFSTDKFTGVVLRNNIIEGSINIPTSITYQRVFSTVENNIFRGHVVLTASTFRSNILTNNSATVNISSANIQNNLVSSNQLPATNGNQTYDATRLFVGSSGNSEDGQYKLKGDSPYLTAGFGGTQPGVFGGLQSYVLSGMPPIPSIYELIADGFGSKGAGLPVNIKVKANQ